MSTLFIDTCTAVEKQAILDRITQLEKERDDLLSSTPLQTLSANGRITTHSKIKNTYTKRINNLRKTGAENTKVSKDTITKRLATMEAKYDGKHCNVNKMKQTKLKKYGHMFGNKEQIMQTKQERYGNKMGDVDRLVNTKLTKYGSIYGKHAVERAMQTKYDRYGITGVRMDIAVKTKQERYGNKMGDVNKMLQTKLEKYGNKWGNVEASLQTKLEKYGSRAGNVEKARLTKNAKYGNAWGDAQKILKTKVDKYGNLIGIDVDKFEQLHGVKYPCQLPQCTNNCTISKINRGWQSYIKEQLGKTSTFEYAINGYRYDLLIDNLAIEVNPTFSHNYDYSFAHLRYGSKNANLPIDTHFKRMLDARKQHYDAISIFDWDEPCNIIDLIKWYTDDTLYNNDSLQIAEVTNDNVDVMAFAMAHNIALSNHSIIIAAQHNNDIVQFVEFVNVHRKHSKYVTYKIATNASVNKNINALQQIVNYFVNTYNAKTILVDVDLSKYDCSIYEMSGFKLINVKFEPTWCRLRFKKSTINVIKQSDIDSDNIKQLLNVDVNNIDIENSLLLHGYVRVYDCGHATLVYHI